jgi:uncharacterized protein YbjT (DUF2867 family)
VRAKQPPRKTITLAGANGRLRPLAPLLLRRGHRVRVVTRDTESVLAEQLRARGAEIRRGDFDEPATIVSAARGADALFAAGTAHRAGPDGELRHGIAAADAAKASAVAQFVYLSGSAAGLDTGVPVFDAKGAVEAHIRSLGLPHTIVAPVYLMENLFNAWNLPALSAGILPSPVDVGRPLQQVAIDDVATFAALVLEHPDEFAGERVQVAFDELTANEAARVLSRLAGRPFAAQRASLEALPVGLARLFGWLERVGDHVDIAALHARYPQVRWLSFERWAARQDWRALARGDAAA